MTSFYYYCCSLVFSFANQGKTAVVFKLLSGIGKFKKERENEANSGSCS